MNLYWQVYKNLEREMLSLAEVIHINDKQQDVYSMKIADLIIRTVVEIESIAKDLYLTNGGVQLPDDEMFFDTVCMNFLNTRWHLEQKTVMVTAPSIYFTIETNKILHPLNNANKRGNRSADWNKAYQAVKHNRAKELEKGSIKHLLHALAALYVLNLYYKSDTICNIKESETSSMNSSFGSELFSVKIHKPAGISADGNYQKNANYDECVFIFDHEASSKEKTIEALKAMDQYINDRTIEELQKAANAKAAKGEQITVDWVREERMRIAVEKRIFPIKDFSVSQKMTALGKMLYNCVLNKQQY